MSDRHILPLIIDSRGEAAVRQHIKNVVPHLPANVDPWDFVQNSVRIIYTGLVASAQGLFDFPDDNTLLAPINNGVLHPIDGVKGLAVQFMMAERKDLTAKTEVITLSVAATLWLSSSWAFIGSHDQITHGRMPGGDLPDLRRSSTN